MTFKGLLARFVLWLIITLAIGSAVYMGVHLMGIVVFLGVIVGAMVVAGLVMWAIDTILEEM